ncbi:MAG: hypothetical protein GY928_08535, partial [Colwellia sp.]|nr:hypothetical protein [Colwellia sp.]
AYDDIKKQTVKQARKTRKLNKKTENQQIKEPLIINDNDTKATNEKTLHNDDDITAKHIEKDEGKEIGQKNQSLKDDEEITIHDDQKADTHCKEKGLQNTMELKELSPGIVAQLQRECQFYKDIITALEEGLSSPEFIMIEGTLHRVQQTKTNPEPNMQLCIPKVLVNTVLTLYHKKFAHPSPARTYRTIQARFYWPGMFANCHHFIANCTECRAVTATKTVAPLQKAKVPTLPGQIISIDYVGPLITSLRGNKYIFTV